MIHYRITRGTHKATRAVADMCSSRILYDRRDSRCSRSAPERQSSRLERCQETSQVSSRAMTLLENACVGPPLRGKGRAQLQALPAAKAWRKVIRDQMTGSEVLERRFAQLHMILLMKQR